VGHDVELEVAERRADLGALDLGEQLVGADGATSITSSATTAFPPSRTPNSNTAGTPCTEVHGCTIHRRPTWRRRWDCADRFITNNSADFARDITEIDVTYPSDLDDPG
jgi:hypothetical protein